VLFVDYLTILPPTDDERGGPPPAEAAAAATGCPYVAASAASAGHHAWSAAPWTRRFHLSLRGGTPYHPDAAGMAAVADLVLAALSQDLLRRLEYRPDELLKLRGMRRSAGERSVVRG
jgi:hypothetical protein